MSAPSPTYDAPHHVPVLLAEVVAALDPQPGEIMVDATFGAGGYTRALLDAGATVHAFDRDPDAIAAGQGWNETQGATPRLVLHARRFSEMTDALASADIAQVDGLTMDIGVSSMQIDRAERGFSFGADGPLDMRMSQDGPSAADFLNDADEDTIADVLFHYGEERASRKIARAIVAARPLHTTGQFAETVRKATRFNRDDRRPNAPKDPAIRCFQAVRIHVNAELEELQAGLAAAETLLPDGGRLAVVSFHSLEDRIVKQYLRDASGRSGGSRHMPAQGDADAIYRKPSKAIRASDAELSANPRARSATLRHAVRTAAPHRQAAS